MESIHYWPLYQYERLVSVEWRYKRRLRLCDTHSPDETHLGFADASEEKDLHGCGLCDRRFVSLYYPLAP